jgi:hypothetical protein
LTYNAELVPAGRGRLARRTTQTLVGPIVATLLLVLPVAPASAGSIGSTKAEVSTLEAQISGGSAQIRQLTEQYDAASLQAASLGQQLSGQVAALRSLRAELARSQAVLTDAALQSYMGATGGGVVPTASGSADPAVKAEYLAVASGDVGDNVDLFDLRQRQVSSAVAAIRQEQAANQQVLASAATDRQEALSVASVEQQRLGALQTELASEVQAAAVAKAAASSQGAPVNNGLVDVVKAQTTSSTSTTAPPTTTAPSSPTTTAPPSPTTTAPPVTTVPSPPTTTPPPPTTTTGGGAGGVWLELRTCESGDNYQENTGNGFYGAYQFTQQTWTDLGYPGRPDLEPPTMQDAAAMKLQAEAGWGQWPACAAALGLT